MTIDPHAAFLEDPEGNASHLAACESCRAIAQTLDAPVDSSVKLDTLPLASWEGAAHRSWAFVAVASAIVAGVSIVLCHMAGVSPLHVVSSDASLNQWRMVLGVLTGQLKRAPVAWQIVFGMAFVAVNTVLFLLLRRPPRGINA